MISSAEAPKPPANSDQPKSSDTPGRSTPGPAPPPPGASSDKPEVKPGRASSSQITPTIVPELSLVSIAVAPGTSPTNSDVSATPSASHIPLARWDGNGALLNGYCAIPEYTIINGPTAYWAPVVGCMRSKADCCPFDIAPSTFTIAARAAQMDSIASGADATTSASGSNGGFPSALSPAQAALSKCPSDYHSVVNGCCPS